MAFIRAILSALALFAATALAVAQDSDAPQRRAVVVENMDFYGGDLEPRFNTTFEACERACIADENCTAFTYNTISSACFPKAKFEEMRAFEGAVSARIVELSPVNRSRIEARAADLTFLPAGYIAEAHKLARQIGIEFPSADREFSDLITQARRASAHGNRLREWWIPKRLYV